MSIAMNFMVSKDGEEETEVVMSNWFDRTAL
jgi:hypothetical protein